MDAINRPVAIGKKMDGIIPYMIDQSDPVIDVIISVKEKKKTIYS